MPDWILRYLLKIWNMLTTPCMAPAWSIVTQNKQLTKSSQEYKEQWQFEFVVLTEWFLLKPLRFWQVDHPILERCEVYKGVERQTARANVEAKWQTIWTNAKQGRWTYWLIPNLGEWLHRPLGEMDYFLAQVLSGHGCFKKYLFERHRATHSGLRAAEPPFSEVSEKKLCYIF